MQKDDVQFLDKLTVYEVSPVILGAGIGTGTESIKAADGQTHGSAPTDNADPDEGQTGEASDPSGTAPRVILTNIEIDLLEE